MKIMFIYTIEHVEDMLKPLQSWSQIQFGISYISSVLKANGHQIQLVVLGSNAWWDSIKIMNAFMNEFSPHIICMTAVASQYPFVKKVASLIKSRWPDRYLIIGGVHATLNPTEVINDSFDAVCIGEGEYPVLELCFQIEANIMPQGIANLWIKSPGGKIERNSPRPFLQELDSLPFPDRTIWTSWMKEQLADELTVLLGRGCPYGCTYCCNHALKKVAPGKYVRFRSPEKIIKEIVFLHTTYPTQSRMYFEVESIALYKDWLMEFCKELEAFNSSIDNFISYGSNFRISPKSIDEEIFYALKKANYYKINIGLESGSERIRREILKRDYSNKDFLDVTTLAHKAGLKICVYNMIGLPGETYDDYMETVSLNRQCQPDSHHTGIFFPYPGTELYELSVREGLINTSIDQRLERRRPVINSPQFSKSKILNAYIWFNFRVYKGFKPLWWILKQTLIAKARSSIIIYLFYRRIVRWPGFGYLQKKLEKIRRNNKVGTGPSL
jgi:anaerobic magnesium-protoporphyrin IX monomethyl ester cyclase